MEPRRDGARALQSGKARQRRRQGIWKGSDKGTGKGKGACYKCGHAGHMARDCPDSRPLQDNCTTCGHWGHTAKFCWAGRIEKIGQDAGAQRGRGYAPAGSRPGQGDCTSEETLIPLSLGVPWRNPPNSADDSPDTQQDPRDSSDNNDRPVDIWRLPKAAKGRGDGRPVAHEVGFSAACNTRPQGGPF